MISWIMTIISLIKLGFSAWNLIHPVIQAWGKKPVLDPLPHKVAPIYKAPTKAFSPKAIEPPAPPPPPPPVVHKDVPGPEGWHDSSPTNNWTAPDEQNFEKLLSPDYLKSEEPK